METAILGEGIVQIRADFSRMRQQMSGVQAPLAAGGAAAGSAFGGAFVGAIAGAGVIAGARLAVGLFDRVSVALVSFTGQAIQANAAQERMRTGFEVMLGSGSKADALLRDITEFAKTTPFEIPGLTQAATQLLATGVAADRVIPMLRKLGDAAAGSAQGFGAMPRITLAISQMLSAGKVSGGDMLQLSQAGVPAWDLLAKKMGLSVAELRKMSEQGKLTKDSVFMLVDALGEKFEGMTEKQAGTFEGLASTFRDSWNIAVKEVGEPIFDIAKDSLKGLVAMFDSPAFRSFTIYLKGGMQSFFDAVRIGASRTGDIFRDVFSSRWFKSLLADGKEVVSLTGQLAWNAMQFGLNLQDSVADSALWSVAKIGIDGIMDGFKATLEFLAIFTEDWDNAWHMVGIGGLVVWESIRGGIETMVLRGKENIQNWVVWIVDAFTKMRVAIASVWVGLADDIARYMMRMQDAMTKKRSGRTGNLNEISERATAAGDEMKMATASFLTGAVNEGAGALGRLNLAPMPTPSTAVANTSNLAALIAEFKATFEDSSGKRDKRIFEEDATSLAQQIGRGFMSALGFFNDNLVGRVAGADTGGAAMTAKDAPKFIDAAAYARGIQERLTPTKSPEVEAVTKVEAAVKEGARRTTEFLSEAVKSLGDVRETLKSIVPVYGL